MDLEKMLNGVSMICANCAWSVERCTFCLKHNLPVEIGTTCMSFIPNEGLLYRYKKEDFYRHEKSVFIVKD